LDLLQRLQPLDILFAILWAAIVGWGLQTGIVRQLGMLIGVYAAALLAGSAYRNAGQAAAQAFGRENLPLLEFASYVALFVATFVLIGVLMWQVYPQSRIGRGFGIENALGAVLAAIWGVLFLIAVLTILRYYTVVPWREQETGQRNIAAQIHTSQVAPVLEVVAGPLWQVMAPWFPAPVSPRL
jgi:uncharacterized membrane protein required for colicin V production